MSSEKEEKIVNIIETLENEQLRKDIPEFRAGDTVRVHVKVVEGKTERIQMFEGVVIAKRNHGLRETFTVRRVSYGVGVERTFLLHSPRLDCKRKCHRARIVEVSAEDGSAGTLYGYLRGNLEGKQRHCPCRI